MKVRPVLAAVLVREGCRLLDRLAGQDHLGAVPARVHTFTVGVFTGMTMVVGMPSRCA